MRWCLHLFPSCYVYKLHIDFINYRNNKVRDTALNMILPISITNHKLFSTNVIIYFNFSMPARYKYLSSFAHLSILAVVQSFGKNCIWYDYCWMEYSKLDLFITGYYLSLVSRHNKKWKKYREYTTRNHKTRWPTCYHCQRQTKSCK